jgi:homogentisate 1,2-dioxygenase
MIERLVNGLVPKKHHLQLRDETGHLHFEHCITQDGFDAPYTITYHRHAPHRQIPSVTTHGWLPKEVAPSRELRKRHFLSQKIDPSPRSPLDARIPLLFNADVTLGILKPAVEDTAYFSNGDGDDLFYIHQGGGTLRTLLGDVEFNEGDYVYVPRGIMHRFIPRPGVPQWWLWMECRGGVHIPRQWRNQVGQLRMDAPYCHRDFRAPTFMDPRDEGIRELVIKRGDSFHGFTTKEAPLDVVGWDGSVYPWAFPILNFLAAHVARHLRHQGRAHLQLRAAADRLPPRGDSLPVPALVGRRRRVHLLLQGQLHLAQGREPGLDELPPRGHSARPAPGQLRGEHRHQRDQRARGDARLRVAAAGHHARAGPRRPELPAQLHSLSHDRIASDLGGGASRCGES